MADNTIRHKEEKKEANKKSVFGFIDAFFKLEDKFKDGVPLKYVPYILFTTFMVLIYIANSYYAEKMIRRSQKLKQDIGDLRADYTTMKAQYMFISKQSEVAKRVEKLGLKESKNPPVKVKIEEK